MPAIVLQSESQLQEFGDGEIIVLDFWADWAKPCAQLNSIFDQLADVHPNLKFVKVEAEKLDSVTEKFEISVVPTFLFVKAGKILDKIEGAKAPELTNKVQKYNQEVEQTGPTSSTSPVDSKQSLNSRLEKLVKFAPVMLFMKGTPTEPQCGFSNKMVSLLNDEGIKFSSFNILSDEEVRQGLKEFSNWPTFPQLYVEGKLVGGLDIVKEMKEEGELKSIIPASALKQDLNAKLKALINQAPVMLFMKGSPDAPQCGFSNKMVEILKKNKVEFSSFNILADEEVRQGLKTYSNWPTYPQLYAKGKLLGGLDIVKEMDEDGELQDALS